jgi:hypothetical protein
MSKRNRTGPVCHRPECKEERLRFYTDSTLTCPLCGSCGGHRRSCDPVARFYTRTKKNGECIEWAGGKNTCGYGMVWWQGRNQLAHRVAYTLARGPVPAGMFVLHECDNRPCVNPAHLSVGTQQQNVRDAYARGRCLVRRNHFSGRTHCIHGHEFTPENTYTYPTRLPFGPGVGRACRACAIARRDAKRQLRQTGAA